MRYQVLGTIESRDQGVHQHGKVGQERRETNRDGEAELHEQILHVLLVEAGLEAVEALQKVGEQWEELLVEKIVAATSDGSEESSQQKEVVVGFLG